MATSGKFVAYYRVSTQKQGRSGLGLAAQRQAVADFLNGGDWKIVGEFTEVESGKRSDRPELAKALAMCRLHCARLVIAKLDRLSRNAAFLFNLRDAGVQLVAADMPNANELTVGIMAVVAEDEAKRISERTKAALQAAKARGKKLGGFRGAMPTARMNKLSAKALQARTGAQAADLSPIIKALQVAGKTSLRAIAAGLNEQGIPTTRGGEWSSPQVMRILERLDPANRLAALERLARFQHDFLVMLAPLLSTSRVGAAKKKRRRRHRRKKSDNGPPTL
jgi:DNA invertase Pin-like site-specific DNA recombinase